MMTKTIFSKWVTSLSLMSAGFALAVLLLPTASGENKKPAILKTSVVAFSDAPSHTGAWGEIRLHFTGQTIGTKNVLGGFAVVEPGRAIHGSHRHVEEEYLVITKGTGTWEVEGKKFPAQKGDILYAAPWAYHGVTNTGDEPLEFAVFKFSGKGLTPPQRPNDGRPDELPR